MRSCSLNWKSGPLLTARLQVRVLPGVFAECLMGLHSIGRIVAGSIPASRRKSARAGAPDNGSSNLVGNLTSSQTLQACPYSSCSRVPACRAEEPDASSGRGVDYAVRKPAVQYPWTGKTVDFRALYRGQTHNLVFRVCSSTGEQPVLTRKVEGATPSRPI